MGRWEEDFDKRIDSLVAKSEEAMQNRDKYPLVRDMYIQPIFDKELQSDGSLSRLGQNKLEFIDFVIAAAEKHFAKMPQAERQAEVIGMCEEAIEKVPDCGIALGCVVSKEMKEPRDVQILLGPQRMVGSINEVPFRREKIPHEEQLEQRQLYFQRRLLGEGADSVDAIADDELTPENDPTGAKRLQAQLDELRVRDKKDSQVEEAQPDKPSEAKKDDGTQAERNLRLIMLSERNRGFSK